MPKTDQEKLVFDLISYIKIRLAMSLFPIRRILLNMDREELAELVRGQSEDIGMGIKDLVLKYFPDH
jgi:hypothetical protein